MNPICTSLVRGAISNIHLQWRQILFGIAGGHDHSGDIAFLHGMEASLCKTSHDYSKVRKIILKEDKSRRGDSASLLSVSDLLHHCHIQGDRCYVWKSDKPEHGGHDRVIDGTCGPWVFGAPCFP